MPTMLPTFESGEQFITYVDGEPRVWTVDRGVPRSKFSPDPTREARHEMGRCVFCNHWVVDHGHGCTMDCRCDATQSEATGHPARAVHAA